MRVIAGSARGRKLAAVPGNRTRPTADRVKEAIFNMIGPYFAGGEGLDLFAGTGAMGIESLSRGLDKMIFVDRQGMAVSTIKKNLAATDFSGQAEVYRLDAKKALHMFMRRNDRFDLILIDPPYKQSNVRELLELIASSELLNSGGVIVLEHPAVPAMPECIGRLRRDRSRRYGAAHISLFRHDSFYS